MKIKNHCRGQNRLYLWQKIGFALWLLLRQTLVLGLTQSFACTPGLALRVNLDFLPIYLGK
ncbi:hypothetical protein [Giesbergeria sp.]|uniref:hypothetical protein n=1 Tax=Giesbergeria sp. TaxID=2818473 RepID=UPI002627A397|nr:hypothetical protein [Giesbergeria sp.]